MKRVLLGSLAVVILGLVAVLAWPSRAAAPSPDPAAPRADLALPPPVDAPHAARPGAGTGATGGRDGAADRSAATLPDDGAGDRTTRLDVLVVRADDTPVRGAPVVVRPFDADDRWRDRATARTGADGAATFALRDGEWLCASPLGGIELAVTLQDGRPERVTIVVPETGTLAGRVVDTKGRAIANAAIVLLDPGSVAAGAVAATSGADGTFTLHDIAGPRHVAARHDAHAPSAPQFVAIPAGGTARVELVLHELHGVLEGLVVAAAGGEPLGGALLLFGSDDPHPFEHGSGRAYPPPPIAVRSDAQGRFRSPPLPPGEIAVAAQHRGFGTFRGTATVVAGRSTVLRVPLQAGATVHGVVARDGGGPVGGVLVHSGVRDRFGCRSTRTRADGSYLLTDLPAGAVQLTALDGDGAQATTELQLLPGAEVVWLATLHATERGVVRGRVVDDAAAPLAGWIVTATDLATSRMASDTSGPNGAFELLRLRRGATVRLTARPAGTPGSGFPAEVRDGVAVDGPPVELRVADQAGRCGTLVGRVVGPDGAGRGGTLELWHEGWRMFARYPVAADGTIRVAGVPAGTLQPALQHPEFPRVRLAAVQLAAGGVVDLGTLQLQVPAYVHGTIAGPDGLPPADATVRLLGPGDQDLGKAVYAAGSYRSPPLPAGRYTMLVQGQGVAPGHFGVELAAGEQREIEIRLETGYLRRIRVVSPREAGADVGGWTSVLLRRDRTPVWSAGQPLAGEAEFLAWLAPGDYDVVAVAGSGYRARGSLRCAADAVDGDVPLVLELQR